MKFMLALLLLFGVIITHAQCLEGNCGEGEGKMDMGYATYTGSFKSGKPHGRGTMDYGGGETFTGEYQNGLEQGKGVLTKKGISTLIVYDAGRIVKQEEIKIVGGNAIAVSGCEQGDCLNGAGRLKYESGEIYTGGFKDGKRHGQGTLVFNSGNTLTASFNQNIPGEGSFLYAKEGITFKGSFNADGTPKTGSYTYPETKATVEVNDGVITKIDNPAARRADSLAKVEATRKPTTCTVCNGKGISGYSSATYTTIRHNYDPVSIYLYGRTEIHTKHGKAFPDICTACGGKGKALQ